MRRSGGLGRGLAALLPDGHDQEPHPVERHFPARPTEELADAAGPAGAEASATTETPGNKETAVPDLGT